MNTELSSFLTDVWENRDILLYGAPDPTGATVEDRVYTIYAPMHGGARAGIDQMAYDDTVRQIRPPVDSGWRILRSDWAQVWTNDRAAQQIDCRIYVNAKLDHAAAIFTRILAMSVAPEPPRPLPPLPPRGLAPPRPPRPTPPRQPTLSPDMIASSNVALARRGRFGTVVGGAKIAWGDAAYGGRPDKIVVYLNREGGRQVALIMAQRIAALGPYFELDHVPMTQPAAPGISIGGEVHGNQWTIGTSFGMVRCTLIARALIEAVTGRPAGGDDHDVPLGPVPTGRPVITPGRPGHSPNRLDFVQRVGRLFTTNGIDINAPWN